MQHKIQVIIYCSVNQQLKVANDTVCVSARNLFVPEGLQAEANSGAVPGLRGNSR
jgi:hypothetical protein